MASRAPVDWSATQKAEFDRRRKARVLADTAWALGVRSPALVVGSPDLRRVRLEAKVKGRPSDATWFLAHELLVELEAAAGVVLDEAPATVPSSRLVPGWGVCGVPACATGTAVHPYASGPRCDEHAPWAVAGRARPVPPVDSTLAALRARRGIRPESFALPVSTVVDERAIASGKRHSTTATYQAVRDAQEHHRKTTRRRA